MSSTFSVPGQPINVRAEPAGPHAIELKWESSIISTSIAGYVIRHNGTQDGSVEELEAYSKDMKMTIRKLKPDTFYSFQVAAKSSRGQGAYSPSVLAKTSPSGKLMSRKTRVAVEFL